MIRLGDGFIDEDFVIGATKKVNNGEPFYLHVHVKSGLTIAFRFESVEEVDKAFDDLYSKIIDSSDGGL